MENSTNSLICIDKIFSKLKNYNYNFEKKVKIFDYEKNKYIELNINDYIWFFIQAIDNSNIYEIRFSEYAYLYIEDNIQEKWVKNIKLEALDLNFSSMHLIQMKVANMSNQNLYPSVFKEEKEYFKISLDILSKEVLEYSDTILNKLYVNEKSKIATSFLRVSLNMTIHHSCLLIFYRDEQNLSLFLYDPNGPITYHYNKTFNFVLLLEKILKLKNKNYFKTIKIINQNLYQNLNLQQLTEIKNSNGYCLVYCGFFLYCFISLCKHFENKNFDIRLILFSLNNSFGKIILNNSQNIYITLVSFANKIKDTFIKSVKKDKYRYVDDILNKIDKNILWFFYKFNKNYILEDLDNENYTVNNEQYIEKDYQKRDYDEELKFLDWNNIKEKRENEQCKINEECISKLCVKNKCTKPNDNDKLDFLTRLEWKEIKEEENERKKIIDFCKDKTVKKFESLNQETKDFFLIVVNYMINSKDWGKIRNGNNFSIYLDLNRKIIDYEEKYLMLGDFLNGKKNIYKILFNKEDKYFIKKQPHHDMEIFYCKNFFLSIKDYLYKILNKKFPKITVDIGNCLEKIIKNITGENIILQCVLCEKYEPSNRQTEFKNNSDFTVFVTIGSDLELFINSEKLVLENGSVTFLPKKYKTISYGNNKNPTINLIFNK